MSDLQELHGFKLGCNPQPYGVKSGMPKLSDAIRIWTRQEIMDFLKTKPVKLRRKQFAGKDWIKNQGQIGSCNACASTGVLRRAAALNGVNSVPDLNWEFLYAQINGGSDNGSQLADANKELLTVGVPELTQSHRFNRDIYKQNYKQSDYDEAKKWRAERTFEIHTEEELATLVLGGTGAADVAINVGNNFMNIDSNGCPGASSGPGNHAVGVQDVELVDGRLLFDSFNSWDLDFGDNGYMYLEWNRHFVHTIQYHGFYAVLAVDVKSQDDSSPVVN